MKNVSFKWTQENWAQEKHFHMNGERKKETLCTADCECRRKIEAAKERLVHRVSGDIEEDEGKKRGQVKRASSE